MQDAVQSRSQLPSVLCQGNCPQNVASVPQNKQPLGQPCCVPKPGVVGHGVGGVWGDGAQHGKDNKQ